MATSDFDRHVGARIAQRRIMLGISQTALGNASGISFQQVQKYEKGSNRISIGRLSEFAATLDAPITHFLEVRGIKAKAGKVVDDPLAKRATLEMVKAFAKLPTSKQRAVRAFLAAMLKA